MLFCLRLTDLTLFTWCELKQFAIWFCCSPRGKPNRHPKNSAQSAAEMTARRQWVCVREYRICCARHQKSGGKKTISGG